MAANQATAESSGDVIVDFGDEFADRVLVADCLPILLGRRGLSDARGRPRRLAGPPEQRARKRAWRTSSITTRCTRSSVRASPAAAYQIGPEVAEHFTNVPGAVTPDAGDRSRLDLRASPSPSYSPSTSSTATSPSRVSRPTAARPSSVTAHSDPAVASRWSRGESSRETPRRALSLRRTRRHAGHADGDLRARRSDLRETVTFEGVKSLEAPAVVALAQLWYLVAGLSYYKAGAARRIDVGTTPLGTHGPPTLQGRALRRSRRVRLPQSDYQLSDVTIEGRDGRRALRAVRRHRPRAHAVRWRHRLGRDGRDSCAVSSIRRSSWSAPPSGRFAPLEATAAVTGLDIVRASRTLDPQIVRGDESFFNGHVPVTTMVTLLAAVAAVASGRGGVALEQRTLVVGREPSLVQLGHQPPVEQVLERGEPHRDRDRRTRGRRTRGRELPARPQ